KKAKPVRVYLLYAFLRIYFYFKKVLTWLNEGSVCFPLKLMGMGSPYHFGKIVRLDTIWTQINRFPVHLEIGNLISTYIRHQFNIH
ncbi:hypothetical protein ACQCV7_29775, partial [Bacillus thuringiensis]